MLPASAPRTEGGVWVSRSAERAVLLATTRADGSDLDGQQHALEQLRDGFAPYAAQGLKLVVSGAGTFAVASRAQIKHEVERLAIAGSAAIVLLMWLAFGSLRALAIAVLPVGTGVLAGIATVSLAFGQVHGITLGFGTTLIGEAVDYAIYYLIQAHERRAAAARGVRPALPGAAEHRAAPSRQSRRGAGADAITERSLDRAAARRAPAAAPGRAGRCLRRCLARCAAHRHAHALAMARPQFERLPEDDKAWCRESLTALEA